MRYEILGIIMILYDLLVINPVIIEIMKEIVLEKFIKFISQ